MKVRFLLCSLALVGSASAADQSRLNFVTCPIVRDTPSVPCWLAEHDGELYYLGIQTDVSAEFQPPYLGHQVLVEGRISDKPRICGGVVLTPVRISVMPELDRSCNTRLPVDPRYTIDFNPRPPGPSAGRLAFADARPPAPEPVKPPFVEKTFAIYFDFDQGVSFRHPQDLMAVVRYARETGARRILINGHRGATLLSAGGLLAESEWIAERRARQLKELFTGAGVTATIEVAWQTAPVAADGDEDWRSRSAEVRVVP
jgi:outer membrane protein OmpA-like peptidoglycan-associated protein